MLIAHSSCRKLRTVPVMRCSLYRRMPKRTRLSNIHRCPAAMSDGIYAVIRYRIIMRLFKLKFSRLGGWMWLVRYIPYGHIYYYAMPLGKMRYFNNIQTIAEFLARSCIHFHVVKWSLPIRFAFLALLTALVKRHAITFTNEGRLSTFVICVKAFEYIQRDELLVKLHAFSITDGTLLAWIRVNDLSTVRNRFSGVIYM